jgi:hypothetical protein
MKLRHSLLLTIAACFAMTFPSIANATPVLQLSSGGVTITVADGDPLDANSSAGVVTYLGPIGSWTMNVTTGQTDLGSMTAPVFDLNSTDTSSSGDIVAADLVIMLSDTGFQGGALTTFNSTIGGTTSGTLTYKIYYGTGLFDLSNEIGDLSFSTNPFSGAVSVSGVTFQNYSLTQVVTISHPVGYVSSSFNAMLSNPVPEPSTLILFGSGLAGTCLFFRRRK